MKTRTGGWWTGVLCALLSQINEHDKLLLLAPASPQVAKGRGLTLYSESLGGAQPSSNPHPFPFH